MSDIYLLPIERKAQIESNQIDGLYLSGAPRRAQRARSNDLLIFWMTVITNNDIPAETQQAMLRSAAETYFKARGSVTAGMTEAVNHLNQHLHDLSETSGSRIGAKMNIAILRENTLYLAHAGAVYTFLLQQGKMTPFFSATSHSQVLGYVDQVRLKFYQTPLETGDVFLLAPAPAQGWNKQTLVFEHRCSLQSIRRRLLTNTIGDFQSVVLQLQEGKGEFHKMRLANPAEIPPPAREPRNEKPAVKLTPVIQAEADDEPAAEKTPPTETRSVPAEAETTETAPAAPPPTESVGTETDDEPAAPQAEPEPERSAPLTTRPAPEPEPQPERPSFQEKFDETIEDLIELVPIFDLEESKRRFAEFWLNMRKRKSTPPSPVPEAEEAENLEDHPDFQEESEPDAPENDPGPQKPGLFAPLKLKISNAMMLFIAIAVPLVIVAVAATVYIQKGLTQQYETYYSQAEMLANQANRENDPTIKGEYLTKALELVEQAEDYRATSDTQALHLKIETQLDEMNGIHRLPIYNVLENELLSSIQITKLVSSSQNLDLYALDGSEGRVLRFSYTGSSYRLDNEFTCGENHIDPLIDIKALSPLNKYKAPLAALSAGGDLFYCMPGADPVVVSLTVPYLNWKNLTNFMLTRNMLYVLDNGTRALWEYFDDTSEQNFNGTEPYLYFEVDPPTDLSRVLDIAILNDSFFMLDDENNIWSCIHQTLDEEYRECKQLTPATAEDAPLPMDGVKLSRVESSNVPSALYLMDESQEVLYRFSIKMKLDKLFRFYTEKGETKPKDVLTAFTVTNSRWAILAYGNEIYYTQLP
ncbi:MAG: hypothetical protein JW750_09070 [Anaerolineaceae bacterium]|nr:hypothetical protein [Anaerolineaceae bacterium]